MPSISDDEVAYLKSLGFSGSLADLRKARLNEMCDFGGGGPIYRGSTADQRWVLGLDLNRPLKATHSDRDLFVSQGVNRLFNDTSDWNPFNAFSTLSTVADATAPVGVGRALSAVVTATGAGITSNAHFRSSGKRFTVSPGRIYTLSCYAKWIAGTLKPIRINISWLDAAGSHIVSDNSQEKTITDTGYTRIANNDNLSPNDAKLAEIRVSIPNSVSGDTIQICGPMFELGNWQDDELGTFS